MPIYSDIQERLANQYLDKNNITDAEARKGVTNQFGVNLYRYPSDLGNNDLLHYVEFSINVRGKSKFSSNRLFEVKRNPDSANLSTEEIGKVAATAGAVATGVLAGGLAKKFAQKYGKTGAAATDVGSSAIGVGVGLGAAAVTSKAINSSSLLSPDTSYRISDVIALHVDSSPTVRYSMNYANKELGTLAGIIKGGVQETMKNIVANGETQQALFATFAKLPGALGMVDVQTALSASSKTSLNPFKEVVFESVDFRSFAFRYKFLPKNKQESEAIRNIIHLFKFHMHPELSPNKLFFIYPSEFQVTYYFESSENSYFHKFAPCSLESMDVTYGGETFSSFDDGNPTEINMTLVFRELEIITKDMINKGF